MNLRFGIIGYGFMGHEHMTLLSDFDGIDCCPIGLENPADIPALLSALRKRGYSEATIEDIAGKNLLRYFAML